MISFRPKRGAILICDFDVARLPPEMDKVRQCLVVSVDELNHRHASAPGTCTVVPFSTKRPSDDGLDSVFFEAGRYWSLSQDSWAKAKMVQTVSHTRLDLILRNGRRHPSEFLKPMDMDRIDIALRAVLGLT